MIGKWVWPLLVLAITGCATEGYTPPPVSSSAQRANELLRSGDYAGALRLSQEALETHPNDPVLLAIQAETFDELGDYEKARPIHDAVLSLTPLAPHALANACWTRALANVELDKALGYCNAAISVSGNDLALYDTRGFLYLRRHDYQLALTDYTSALRSYPNLASSLYGRGLARLAVGDHAGGEMDISHAASIQKDIAAVYAKRGLQP